MAENKSVASIIDSMKECVNDFESKANAFISKMKDGIEEVENEIDADPDDKKIEAIIKEVEYVDKMGVLKLAEKYYKNVDLDDCEEIDVEEDVKNIKMYKRLVNVYPTLANEPVVKVVDRYDSKLVGGTDESERLGWVCVTSEKQYIIIPSFFLDEEREEYLTEEVCICGTQTIMR